MAVDRRRVHYKDTDLAWYRGRTGGVGLVVPHGGLHTPPELVALYSSPRSVVAAQARKEQDSGTIELAMQCNRTFASSIFIVELSRLWDCNREPCIGPSFDCFLREDAFAGRAEEAVEAVSLFWHPVNALAELYGDECKPEVVIELHSMDPEDPLTGTGRPDIELIATTLAGERLAPECAVEAYLQVCSSFKDITASVDSPFQPSRQAPNQQFRRRITGSLCGSLPYLVLEFNKSFLKKCPARAIELLQHIASELHSLDSCKTRTA